MKVEIIAVGTELLMGQTVNTNAAYLGRSLASLDFGVYYQQVIGDNEERLLEAIALAASRSDLVLLTGGLGPTEDDLTKQTLARYLQRELVEDEQGLAKILQYHHQAKKVMSENNRRQILVFDREKVFYNPVGLALGCAVKQENCMFILLPGPPNELEVMFEKEVKPYLVEQFVKREKLLSHYLHFFGIGESRLVTELADLIEGQTNPTIAPYAATTEVVLRVTASAKTISECETLLQEIETKILSRVGEFCYGIGENITLAGKLVELLQKNKLTVAAAESLTAGLFQAGLAEVAGVSSVFKGGVVTYQTNTKKKILGIPSELVQKYGVVSKECACLMAEKVREMFDASIGISFTGVAGPSTQEDKEIGIVFIGIADDTRSRAFEFHYGRGRNWNRWQAAKQGMDLLRRKLSEK